MEYDSILQKIQEAREDHSVIDLYRYNGLMQAIDFFSNRLSFEQIVSSAYEFVNELLTVSQSVMYIFDGKDFIPVERKGLSDEPQRVPSTKKLESFAVFCGSVLSDRAKLEDYFDRDFLESSRVQIMIPLSSETTLEGFILLISKNGGAFVPDDTVICDAMMRIFTSALENHKRLVKLQEANNELDEKVFNLFAINESSKILLAQHDMEALYSLSLDVFSELTQSSRTSFFLFDQGSEKYTLKAYRDIYHSKFARDSVSLTLNPDKTINPMQSLIDTGKSSDVEYFNDLFMEGMDALSFSNPLYIVLLLKDTEVLGLVTLSTTVSGSPYKKGVFELVESLASYTYIAITNAILLDKLEQQRKLLQEKLDRLQSLNLLMKNVNSAENLATLQELIITTLEVSFGVEKGAIALFLPSDQRLAISCCAGFAAENSSIVMNDRLQKLCKGSIILETDEEEVYHYIGRELEEAIGEKSGFLAVPIVIEKYELQLMGSLLIFKMRNGLLSDEENLIVLETIANLSAPLLQNFIRLEFERGALCVNQKETFLREMEKQTLECSLLDTPLEVIHIETQFPLFTQNIISENLQKELEFIYNVDHNHIFIIVTSDFHYCRHKVMEAAGQYDAKIAVYVMGSDFNGFKDFIGQFQK
ncbi:MAG: hypothetical protein GX115_09280 [Ruminiclostridium sp.]|nr:hypothetical protein [Ruminiclostridium sp.]